MTLLRRRARLNENSPVIHVCVSCFASPSRWLRWVAMLFDSISTRLRGHLASSIRRKLLAILFIRTDITYNATYTCNIHCTTRNITHACSPTPFRVLIVLTKRTISHSMHTKRNTLCKSAQIHLHTLRMSAARVRLYFDA